MVLNQVLMQGKLSAVESQKQQHLLQVCSAVCCSTLVS